MGGSKAVLPEELELKCSPEEIMPATLLPELLQGLLRGHFGFNGLIITDASTMAGFNIAMERRKAVPACIAAGL